MNILIILLLAQTKAIPMKKSNCILSNQPYILMHKDGSSEEREDWFVDCTVTIEDKVVSKVRLNLAHPTEFPEAAAAAREFVKKK